MQQTDIKVFINEIKSTNGSTTFNYEGMHISNIENGQNVILRNINNVPCILMYHFMYLHT